MTATGNDLCFNCRAGFCNECAHAWCDELDGTCCCGGEIVFTPTGEVKGSGVLPLSNPTAFPSVDTGYVDDGYFGTKDISEYKDPVSTGRKRAAEMYPIEAGMVCEWANLKFAGGGVKPIVGCVGRPATDRHHGPDKNTMNNAPTNMHRICSFCHNTWHGVNDPFYGERPEHTKPFIPNGEPGKNWFAHDPNTKASPAEVLAAEQQRVENATK